MKQGDYSRSYRSMIHWPERLWQSVAWTVIVCFSVNCLTPAVVAAKTLAHDAKLYAAPAKSEYDLASDALIVLEDTLDRMNRRLNGQFEFAWQDTLAQKSHATPPAAAKRADLAALESSLASNRAQLDAQQPTIQAFFAQTQSDLKTHSATSVIQTRAQAQAAQYAQLYAQLTTLLAAIPAAKTDADYKAAVAAATTFLHAHSSKPKRAKFDPKHLAFGPPKERARKALTDPAAIRAAIGLSSSGTTQAAPASIKATATATAATQSSSRATSTFALTRVPAKLQASNKKSPASRASHPQAAQTATLPPNLSPTEDVQITPAIIAKAQALNNNPLAIYQFVRNNVEYLPTYGSIEGSDYTLQTLRGNDIDQASLLIALLRAANIPAHYVYGTIRVPIAQVENWVGGVTDSNAALDLMGQGGIPTLGLAQGGVIQFAQIEHVWVEAQIGFAPSRGAKTTPGTTWVPMDPSFKQYTYTQGMNLQTAVPFDSTDFVNHIQSTSTINTTQGWVQNVDQNYINTQLTSYQTQVQNYVSAQNPNATVGDVIGTKTIQPETLPLLAGSLPYTVTATASMMDSLPDTLRWAFQYQADGQTLLSQGLPDLIGKRLAYSFSPATSADQSALLSYIPTNATSYADLPTSLPAGVVQLQGQLSIDGQTVATGSTYGLGDDVLIQEQIYQPGIGWIDNQKQKHLSAGDYQVIALDPTDISPAQAAARETALQSTQAQLQAHNFATLTKHDVGGAILETVAEAYMALTSAKAQIGANASGQVTYRLPSFGTVATNSDVSLFFGVPARFTPKGVLLDMDRIASISDDKSGNVGNWMTFNQAMGQMSSVDEGSIPAQVFSTNSQQPLQGVSAVASLAAANQQGQKIYTIDASNSSTAMASLNQPQSVMQDIADSVNAGLNVTISQSPVVYAGQTTSGYIVEDPTTGAAAYRIDSIADGGKVLLGVGFILLMILMVILFQYALVAAIVLTVEAGAEVIATIVEEISFLALINNIIKAYDKCKSSVAPGVALSFVIVEAITKFLEGTEDKNLVLSIILFLTGEALTDQELEQQCPSGG